MAKKVAEDPNSITIGGRRIRAEIREVPISELQYYEENPRIYSIIVSTGIKRDQSKIQTELWNLDSTKELFQAIKFNKGLLDEIVVYGGKVLEGNRRLCVYRKLFEQSEADEERTLWGKIRSKVILEPISPEEIFIYLGTLHVKGKAEWKPFEQAGFIWRMKHQFDKPAEVISQMIHLKAHNVRHMLRAYELMKTEGIEDQDKFSYFLEYAKRAAFAKLRREDPKIESTVVELIKADKIPRAEEIRRLPDILKDKKARRAYLNRGADFQSALETAHANNPEEVNTFYRQLTDTRDALRNVPIMQVVSDIRNDNVKRTKIHYFLKQVRTFEKQIQWDKNGKGSILKDSEPAKN